MQFYRRASRIVFGTRGRHASSSARSTKSTAQTQFRTSHATMACAISEPSEGAKVSTADHIGRGTLG
eukprot:388436-Rhodomonas_salina.2